MPTSLSVHRIKRFEAAHAKSDKSVWLSITAIDEKDEELIEVTFFTNGNLELAKAIAEAINGAQAPQEEEIVF